MSAFDEIRRASPWAAEMSDAELLQDMSRVTGIPIQDVASAFGVETGAGRSWLGAGLSSGTDQLQGLGYSFGGAIADAAGWDAGRDWFNRRANINQIEAQINSRPDLEQVETQTLGSALPFAGYQLAKQGPLFGALFASQLVPGLRGATHAVGLSRLGATMPKILGGGGLRAGADFAARRAALTQGEALGASAITGSALGAGSMYQESVDAGDPNPWGAFALAPIYGLAEAAVPSAVGRAFRAPTTGFSGDLLTRMGKAGALGAVGESGTELLQNELEMSMRSDLTPDEVASRRLNAAVIGAVAGGPLGSLGGIPRPRTEAATPPGPSQDDAVAPLAPTTDLPILDDSPLQPAGPTPPWGIPPTPTNYMPRADQSPLLPAESLPWGRVPQRPAWIDQNTPGEMVNTTGMTPEQEAQYNAALAAYQREQAGAPFALDNQFINYGLNPQPDLFNYYNPPDDPTLVRQPYQHIAAAQPGTRTGQLLTPTSTVRSEFDLGGGRRGATLNNLRLALAENVDQEAPSFARSAANKYATKLAGVLAANIDNPDRLATALDNEQNRLESSRARQETTAAQRNVLDAAREIAARYGQATEQAQVREGTRPIPPQAQVDAFPQARPGPYGYRGSPNVGPTQAQPASAVEQPTLPFEGVTNAVQEQSAAPLDARQRAGDGGQMGAQVQGQEAPRAVEVQQQEQPQVAPEVTAVPIARREPPPAPGPKTARPKRTAEQLRADADAIEAMDPDVRDDTPIGDLPGSADAFNLYEARKLAPKPKDTLKRVGEDRNPDLAGRVEYVANVDGRIVGVTRQEDPDAVDDDAKFVYAYEFLDEPLGKLHEPMTADKAELFGHIRATARRAEADRTARAEQARIDAEAEAQYKAADKARRAEMIKAAAEGRGAKAAAPRKTTDDVFSEIERRRAKLAPTNSETRAVDKALSQYENARREEVARAAVGIIHAIATEGSSPAVRAYAADAFRNVDRLLRREYDPQGNIADDSAPMAERIKSKPGTNTARMAKLLGPKLYGDPRNMDQVSLKEMLQNAFDAIKAVIAKNPQYLGQIHINMDPDTREITVYDNGAGMSPEVLGNEFLQIAGTSKETDQASGGLGIAKMMFLFGSEQIRVETARNGVVSRLDTSGPQLFEALDNSDFAPEIRTSSMTGKYAGAFPDGHGTRVTIRIPRDYKDATTGEVREINFRSESQHYHRSLVYSPLFANINVQFNGRPVKGVGATFPVEDYTQLANVHFDWGTAHIYVSKKANTDKYSPNLHVLSNGLHQFSFELKKPSQNIWEASLVPKVFYIDVSPDVRPEDAGYPFDLNRQRFSPSADAELKKIFTYLQAMYSSISLSDEANSFGSIQYLTDGDRGVVVSAPEDVSPKAPKMEGNALAAIEEGDDVEVRGGKLIVNGRAVPELRPEDLAQRFDVSKLKIDQNSINPDAVMLHDNLLVVDNTAAMLKGARSELDSIEDKLRQERRKKNPDWARLAEIEGTRASIWQDIAELEGRGPDSPRPITEAARAKFGNRFDEFMRDIGATFIELRDAVADVMSYPELRKEAVGISFDKEYRGVSIRLPFSGQFINPGAVEKTDASRAALGMYFTMIHELAHHKVRSHDASFPAEMQRIMYELEDNVDTRIFRDDLRATVARNHDILLFLNKAVADEKSKPRGKRFADGQDEARDGSRSEDVDRVGGAGQDDTRALYQRNERGSPSAPEGAGRSSSSRDDGRGSTPNVSSADVAEAGKFNLPEPDNFGRLSTAYRTIVSGLSDWRNSPWTLGWFSMRQLQQRFGSGDSTKQNRVDKFVNSYLRMGSRADEIMREVNSAMRRWMALPMKVQLELGKVALTATTEQIHPHVPFDHELNKHLSPDLDRARYERVKAEFNKLVKEHPRAKEVYLQALDTGERLWNMVAAAQAKDIAGAYEETLSGKFKPHMLLRLVLDKAERDKMRGVIPDLGLSISERRALRNMFDAADEIEGNRSRLKGPYFPLRRFGNHVVVAKSGSFKALQDQFAQARDRLQALYDRDPPETDAEEKAYEAELVKARKTVRELQQKLETMKSSERHYSVSFFEHNWEAGRYANKLRSDADVQKYGLEVSIEQRPEYERRFDGASPQFIRKMEQQLAAKVPKSDLRAVQDAVRDIYLRSSPDRSALKSELKRLNVPGARPNEMLRGFAMHGMGTAFRVSRMEYGRQLNEALADLRSSRDRDDVLLGNELGLRYAQAFTSPKQSRVINSLSQMAHLTYLGLSPSYILMNMSQPWVISLPVMAARHGYMRSGSAMLAAAGEVAKVIRHQQSEEFKKLRGEDASGRVKGFVGSWRFDLQPDQLGKTEEERLMIQELFNAGLINITIEHDVAATSSGTSDTWLGKASDMAALPAHITEIVNRVSTALAAFRLQKQRGSTYDQALDYATNIVADTHFDYSGENAARFMRADTFGGAGRLIWQFKKYQQGMFFLMGRMLRDATRGDKEAAKGAAYLTGSIVGVAGVSGFFFSADLMLLAKAIAQLWEDDDEPDLVQMAYNGLKDAVGEELARAIWKGIPAALGVDLSGRLAAPSLAANLRLDGMSNKQPREIFGAMLLGLAGPAAGMMANWADAAMLASRDPVRAAGIALPRFVGDPLKAYQRANEGIRTRYGDQLVDKEEFGPGSLILKGIGLEQTRVTDMYQQRAAVNEAKTRLNETRNQLIRQFAQARLDGEPTGPVMDQIAAFNRRNPPARITMDTLRRSLENRRKAQRETVDGVRVRKQERSVLDQVGL